MKLKQLVVASMSVLGLMVSCSTFAEAQTTQATSTTNTTETTQTTHVKHHKVKHHQRHCQRKAVSSEVVALHTYKDMGALAEVCPKVDMYDSMLDMMNHNVGRARPTLHCTDPLSLAGGIAFDSAWGNRHRGYAGENTARLSLNDAYVNVYGNVNNWTTAMLSLSYNNAQPSTAVVSSFPAPSVNQQNGLYSASYPQNNFTLEQGYITFRNMNVTPIFLRIGKMFQDFNRYSIHPMTQSMTQVMSETLRTSAALGFMTSMGLNGSVYTFNNPMYQKRTTGSTTNHSQNNYGVSLNWNHPNDQLGYDIGIGYMNDFTGVNDVAYSVNRFNGTTTNLLGYNGTYQSRVGAATVYGDLNSGPFTLEIRYVTATSSFNALDLPTRTLAAITAGAVATGAKPWSADITGGFGFMGWSKDQNVYLGYQASGNAVNLFLPKQRWLVGYGINILKNTNVGLQWNHDIAYSTAYTGAGNHLSNSNTVMARAAVQFG